MEKGSGSAAGGSGDYLDGLKFGKKIYFEDSGGGSGSSKPAAAGKKCKSAAPAGGGLQKPPRCQVEGCSLDLTGTKAYYCRHKVCGPHSKSPSVTVAGLEQRFCQQCSRFHLLSEFDQEKRSCRRRLAGHNERRRKPPPGPLISRFGRLSSFQDDSSRYRSYLMDFTYPRSTMIADNQWQGSFDAQTSFATSNSNPALFAAPKLALGDCLVGVPDSSCALSLLSSQPWDATAAAAAAPPGNHESPLIPASGRIDCGPMAQLNMASSYMNGHWGFKDLVSESSSIEMGLSNCHFSSELELALQGNKQRPDELELGHREVYGPGQSKMHRSL